MIIVFLGLSREGLLSSGLTKFSRRCWMSLWLVTEAMPIVEDRVTLTICLSKLALSLVGWTLPSLLPLMPAIVVCTGLRTVVCMPVNISKDYKSHGEDGWAPAHKLLGFVGLTPLWEWSVYSLLPRARLYSSVPTCPRPSSSDEWVMLWSTSNWIVLIWKLSSILYSPCSFRHPLAIQPSSARPHPIWSCSCPAVEPITICCHPDVWSCHCCKPLTISFHSWGCVWADCSQVSSSSRVFSHCLTADSARHLKMWSLSSTEHGHCGHLAWDRSPQRHIFFPSGRNLVAALDTHCRLGGNAFMALSADFQSIICSVCWEIHPLVRQ